MYWQQKADYKMSIELDDENQRIYGDETITYTNNSPDVLNKVFYHWATMIKDKQVQVDNRPFDDNPFLLVVNF